MFLKRLRYLLLSAFILSVGHINAEDISLFYRIEGNATFSGGENTPFWMISNIHGLGDPELNNGYLRGQIYKPMKEEKSFDWGGGIDLAGGWDLPYTFRIQQLYGEIHYRAFQVTLGSKDYYSEYNDPRLSSGDLLYSGNALAIPQLRIGTTGFAPFWGTKGWLSVKAYLSYGMFTDSNWEKHWVTPGYQWASDILFCSRGLWFRIGKKEVYPLTLDLGIEMETQFGGTIHQSDGDLKMPNGFIDWLKAFIPFAGNSSTPESEQTNVQGNMNGEYNVSISWNPAKNWNLRVYYEHFFEDHSQMFLEYGFWKDGLVGVELTFPENPFVNKFLYEYVATKDQTGAVNHDYTPEIPEQVSGRDGYYSHYLYGPWQNWGMSMGTPFAISPLYNRSHRMMMYNSRFILNHFGVEGNPLENLRWRMLLSFSQNWGTYNLPLPYKMNNFSGLVEVEGKLNKLPGWFAKVTLAWDRGALLGNNFGGMISIGYQGNITFRD